MLRLTIAAKELFNEADETFINTPEITIEFEHSLLAVSKWESKYQIPFLSTNGESRTTEQISDYIEAMALSITKTSDDGTQRPIEIHDRSVLSYLSSDELQKINRYIESKESATTFNDGLPGQAAPKSETITSELVYYWMVASNIPFECETWNLNRLFALIKICGIKNSPQKKMPRHAIASRNRELNNARRAQMGTTG